MGEFGRVSSESFLNFNLQINERRKMAKQQKVVIDNVDANCSQRGTFLNDYKQIWCPYDVKSL